MLRTCTALLLLLSTLAPTTATQQRDTRCDDAVPLRASCNFALTDDPQVLFHCGEAEILAQQASCYRCVDASTCRRHRDYAQVGLLPREHHKDAHITATAAAAALAPSPSMWPLQKQMAAAESVVDEPAEALAIESDVVDIDLPFIPDALSTAESAEFNAASVRFSGDARQEVSNWYFLAPAVLAMASLGLAVRSRVQRDRHARFERMGDACDREDEINPFCESMTNLQDDNDGGVEFAGGRYVVDEDEDEDREHGHEHEHGDLEGTISCDGSAFQDVDNDCGFAIVVSSSPSTFST